MSQLGFQMLTVVLLLPVLGKESLVAAQSKRTCSSSEFICTDGQCVSSEKRCDGNFDCQDQSDENCCNLNSNSGKEFVVGFLTPHGSRSDTQFLFLSSSKSLNYTVRAPRRGITMAGSVVANTLISVQLPIQLTMSNGISDVGIIITGTEDMTIYGLNQERHTTDAFLALPTHIQGQEYIVPSYKENRYGKSLVGIVGIHNNTQVTIQLSSTASDGVQSFNLGQNVTYTINWMQTLQLEGEDLAGSRVFSDNTIAVFGGHQCAQVPVGKSYCDHLVEQVPPVSTLGSHFATVPLATRTAGDLFRVIASRDGTDIMIDGTLQASGLKAGTFHEFQAASTKFLSVVATQPVLLVQFSLGSSTDSTISDPFMLMIPPIEQFRSNYIISTPAAQPVTFSNYLSIIIEDNKKDGLRLDDQPLSSTVLWNNIPGQTLVGTALAINISSHTVHHIDKTNFGLSIYGYANHDSYGYPGGLQLKGQCNIQTMKTTDINECAANSGRGPCQHICNNTFGSFQCSCNKGYFLQPDRLSCSQTVQSCACSSHTNGICRTGGLCECRPGWGGITCSQPQCHLLNHCSNRGTCVAPNRCQCSRGWTGFGCVVSTCPQFTTCSSCSALPHCGWCDSKQRCMTGTGFGPTDKDTKCPEWFFYHCVTVKDVSISTSIVISTNPFSNRIDIIDCTDVCINIAVANRGNSIYTRGTQKFCDRHKQACQSLSNCYERRADLTCALGKNKLICRVYSEQKCPNGIPPHDIGVSSSNASNVVDGEPGDDEIGHIVISPGQGGNQDLVKTRIDFKFHINCATLKNISEWNDYGCFCESSVSVNVLTVRKPVDATDNCCKLHDECYSAAPPGCDCNTVQSFAYSATCTNWASNICDDVYIISGSDQCKRYCCQCDFNGADCISQHQISKNDKLWKNWMDSNKQQCTSRCGKVSNCNCQPECSGHGVLDGVGRDVFCFCFPGWQGQCCDQPDCSCLNTNNQDCFGNGVCRSAVGDGNPTCSCQQGWTGQCCNRRIPVRRSCDPHLSTADGLEYDYFGIGEFWDCISQENDFGAQIRFFGYKSTSFAGAVAIKTSNVTTSIYTLNDTQGENSLPKLRINGTLINASWPDYPTVYHIGSDYVKLYVQPTRANGSVVQYLFQFSSGATYTVDTRYSTMLGRQYIDTELGLIASFMHQTKGLCGYMDNIMGNDLVSPRGLQIANTTNFTESWRVDQSVSNSGDGSWSWTYSNFHPDDPLDFSYTNPYHRAVYGTNQLPLKERTEAERECLALELEGKLLNDCILDRALTGDSTVLQQQAFQQGKCPNGCSNRGQCKNGTCICVDSWLGEDCTEGGCDNCPQNSQCTDGFCQCNFGHYGPNCTKVTCQAVNNCTNSTHGLCKAPDVCQCNPGYVGDDCGTKALCSHNCSHHGTCLGGDKCLCYVGYGGSSCNMRTCENFAYCSGHGSCRLDGTCECNTGWQGSACDLFSCDDVNSCSGHGDCITVNTCSCHTGYTGSTCSELTTCSTRNNCSGNGVCVDRDTCLCYSGYFGDECDTFECSQGCSGRGTCEAPEVCSCILGWTGYDCSVPSCEQLHYCSGNGKCVGPDTCECDDGWGGRLCSDFDCSFGNRSGNCSSNGNCTALGMCDCNPGYCGNDCQYFIINECNGNVGNTSGAVNFPCDQVCIDTCESYQCTCMPGYILQVDGQSCKDIDECNTTAFAFRLNNCAHQCFNTPGSYYCNCSNGYQLADDQGSCHDIDECGSNHDCSQQCINTPGSYNCSCYNGYQLDDDQHRCNDINECEESRDDCSQICLNSMGSFKCDCRDGFVLTRDGKTCADLPTGSPNDIHIGAIQALITVSSNSSEFQTSLPLFSKTVTREVAHYCQRSSSNQCGNVTTDEPKLYLRVASIVSQNSTVMVIFYVFSINTSTQEIHVIPANHVISALGSSNALQQAGYSLLGLTAAFLPPTEPMTPPTGPMTLPTEPMTPPTEPMTPPTEPMTGNNGSDSSSKAPLIGAIAGGATGVVLLLVILFCVCYKKRRKSEVFSTTVFKNPAYRS